MHVSYIFACRLMITRCKTWFFQISFDKTIAAIIIFKNLCPTSQIQNSQLTLKKIMGFRGILEPFAPKSRFEQCYFAFGLWETSCERSHLSYFPPAGMRFFWKLALSYNYSTVIISWDPFPKKYEVPEPCIYPPVHTQNAKFVV